MCNPAIAMAAVSGVQGALQFSAQRQQAKQQAAYQAQGQAVERQRFQREQSATRLREAQDKEAEARKMEQLALEQSQRVSTGVTAMGEAGAISEAPIDDLYAQYGRVKSAQARQQEFKAVGTELALEEQGFGFQQEMMRLSKPVSKPSLLLSALETGTKAARAYKEFS
jgi:hypothetical protein